MIERYTTPLCRDIWSLDYKYETWARVEIAHLAALGHLLLVEEISGLKPPSAAVVAEAEKVVRHEFEAFLMGWLAGGTRDMQRWVHYGMTSSDVIDTAQAVILGESHGLIQSRLTFALGQMNGRYTELSDFPQLGRTHGQAAVVRTFGSRWVDLTSMGYRWQARERRATEDLRWAAISGPVGGFDLVTLDQSNQIIRSLGLKPTPICSQILARDSLTHWCDILTGIATWVESVATEIRLLAHGDVGEVAEGFGDRQVGSSAMPHKRNPLDSENLCGLARLCRGYNSAIQMSQVQWHDRDLAHSSVERVGLADLVCLVDFMLYRLGCVVDGLQINPDRMLHNIRRAGEHRIQSFVAAHELVDAGFTRWEARAIIARTLENGSHDEHGRDQREFPGLHTPVD